jgi:hypothetical protein
MSMSVNLREMLRAERLVLTQKHAATCDFPSVKPRSHSSRDSRIKIEARIVHLFVTLLALCALCGTSFAGDPDSASETAGRVVPRSFNIQPGDGVSLSANQTQHFAVTNADGKRVPARWKVVGNGCSDSSCGSIDDKGIFRAPASVARPLLVVVRGTLVSNPKRSVSARVRVFPAPVASSGRAQGSSQAATDTNQDFLDLTGQATLVESPEQHGTAAASATSVSIARKSAVTYLDGQLEIDAENETLATVLQLVSEITGATIDVPAGTGLEHIVQHAGPGPANVVIAQLLTGSPFNFVITSSPEHPDVLQQVLLTPRDRAGAPEVVAAAPKAEAPQPQPQAEPEPQPEDSSWLPAPRQQSPLSREDLQKMIKDKGAQIREDAPQQ